MYYVGDRILQHHVFQNALSFLCIVIFFRANTSKSQITSNSETDSTAAQYDLDG